MTHLHFKLPIKSVTGVTTLDDTKRVLASIIESILTLKQIAEDNDTQVQTLQVTSDASPSVYLKIAQDLADLANVVTARSNLGLGDSATKNVGVIAGTVAAGNDTRLLTDADKIDLTDGGETILHNHPIPSNVLTQGGNLAGLSNLATSRSNLGLGNSAVLNVGVIAGTVAAGDDARLLTTIQKTDLTDGGATTLHSHSIAAGTYLEPGQNLSDVDSVPTSRTNLGLGDSATKNVGTGAGTVAAGDDSRLLSTAQKTDLTDGLLSTAHKHHDVYWERFRSEPWNVGFTQSTNGNGSGFAQDLSGAIWAADLGADGIYRMSCGNGSASTDTCLLVPTQWDKRWARIDIGVQRFHWRMAIDGSTNYRITFGIANSNAVTTALPGPCYLFDLDSANTNIEVYYAKDATPTVSSTTDTGVGLSSVHSLFRWFTIEFDGSNLVAYIDGIERARQSTNLPTGNNLFMSPRMYIQGNGSTWRSAYYDDFVNEHVKVFREGWVF